MNWRDASGVPLTLNFIQGRTHKNNVTGNAEARTKCWRVYRAVPLHRRIKPTNSSRTTNVCQLLVLGVSGLALHSHQKRMESFLTAPNTLPHVPSRPLRITQLPPTPPSKEGLFITFSPTLLTSRDLSAGSFACVSLHLAPVLSASTGIFGHFVGSRFLKLLRKYMHQLAASNELMGRCYIPGCQDRYDDEPNAWVISFPSNRAFKQRCLESVTVGELVSNKHSWES